MSEEQDYKTIATADGTVKVRSYTTGADEEAIMALLTGASRTIIDDDNKSSTEVDATVQVRLNRTKIERFVVDIDGKTENYVGRIYDLRSADFAKVLDYINEVTKDIDGSTEATKKKSKA